MAKNLLIVESPAKAKTINKYLGKDFQVLASYGHVRDLVPKEGAVDPGQGFAMNYDIIDDRSRKHVDAIAKATKTADNVFLATDPDREGEAISWHVAEILRERGLLEGRGLYRVVFSEITPRAIREAMAHPRQVLAPLVNAQQARRALDYLVGFNLSPLLWRKVQAGLSAGRVQSPALRMIVERDKEIEAFVAREYWSVQADCQHPVQPFLARLVRLDDGKFEQFTITDGDTAEDARKRLLAAAGGSLRVTDVQSRERRRRPAPPFITSTLQQEAARKLGFSAKRTMRAAQKLYEGFALGEEGTIGLISYMRTDSVNLSQEAVAELRDVIARDFGTKALPDKPNTYVSKSKNAQEAHEAIRPTSALRTPASVAKYLGDDERRLYELVWKRSVASQMVPATLNTVSIELACGSEHAFRATGTTVVDPGFLAVYEEGKDSKAADEDDEGRKLPPMKPGDDVPLASIGITQHFTEPPPRYSEASLVKALEEYGIGRPSTYASIIGVLLAREYVTLDSRRFHPTDKGRAVANFLGEHFSRYVDYDFTAKLEDELDAVSRGEDEWVPLLERFWAPFKATVDDKMETVDRSEATGARELGTDPTSGKPLSVRLGRFGAFAQIGTRDDEEKPRFASLRPGQSLHTITAEQALDLFRLPRSLGEFEGEELTVAIGRFGPFVRHGTLYASLKKDDDPYEISRERGIELVREKREVEANRIIRQFPGSAVQVLNGRYGPYISDGEMNGKVPKDRDPASLGLEECERILAETGKPVRRGRAGAKKAAAKKAAVGSGTEKPARKAAGKTAKKSTRKKSTRKTATKAAKKPAKKSGKPGSGGGTDAPDAIRGKPSAPKDPAAGASNRARARADHAARPRSGSSATGGGDSGAASTKG